MPVSHIFSGGRAIAFGLARGDESVLAECGGDCALQLRAPLGGGPQLEGGHLGLDRALAHLERGQRVELRTQRGDLGEFDESRLLFWTRVIQGERERVQSNNACKTNLLIFECRTLLNVALGSGQL